MIGLGGRETLLRLRQGYHITMEAGGDSLEVMAVPRCETCRWWNYESGPTGVCEATFSRKSRSRVSVTVEPALEGARLETAAEFGCVQWEAKG